MSQNEQPSPRDIRDEYEFVKEGMRSAGLSDVEQEKLLEEKYGELKFKSVTGARDQLSILEESLRNAEGAAAKQNAIERHRALLDFAQTVEQGDTDFEGDDKEENAVWQQIKSRMNDLVLDIPEDAPKISGEDSVTLWLNAVSRAMKEKMETYDNWFDTQDKKEADEDFKEVLDSKEGVGTYMEWLEKNHPKEHKEMLDERERVKKEMEAKKQSIGQGVSTLRDKLRELSAYAPSRISDDLRNIEAQVNEAKKLPQLTSTEKSLEVLGEEVQKLESLKEAFDKCPAPEPDKAKILERFKKGEIDQPKAIEELNALAHKTALEEEARACEEAPFVDKAVYWLRDLGLPEKWQVRLEAFALSFAGLFAKWNNFGLRSMFVSNKFLHENAGVLGVNAADYPPKLRIPPGVPWYKRFTANEAETRVSYKAYEELKNIGFSKESIEALSGKKVSDVLAGNSGKMGIAVSEQPQLETLQDYLKKTVSGGASGRPLAEILGHTGWKKPEAPKPEPAPTPAPTAETAPPETPETRTAPPQATSSVPERPSTPEQRREALAQEDAHKPKV